MISEKSGLPSRHKHGANHSHPKGGGISGLHAHLHGDGILVSSLTVLSHEKDHSTHCAIAPSTLGGSLRYVLDNEIPLIVKGQCFESPTQQI